ncbi:MAG TPA: hypothetical protein VHC46_01370 [Thermodesulfobacteriota bacterium]|nr:hypothetical protein [Thermodesulfobacteriota bacterium]
MCSGCGHAISGVKREAGRVRTDESNWEDFVNISKTERGMDEFRIEHSRDLRREDSDFNWENLKINDEPVDHINRIPKMFEDEGTEDEIVIMKDRGGPQEEIPEPGLKQNKPEERDYTGHSPESLGVEMGVLMSGPRHAGGYGGARPYRDNIRIYSSKSRPGGVFAKAAYTLLILIVFAVIIGASYIILSNTGVIPRETADTIERYVMSLIPSGISGSFGNEVVITSHDGRWLDTRNGPMYVISGTVTNKSGRPVNYIKIRSEFISDGQTVYENAVYAGNTFTESELRVSPLSDTLLKLKKKSGDIDYYNADRLSGLNSDIKPGESIPFFAVYPASERMLGLKYNLEVVGYE